ncbi:hypothetical protein P3T27_006305 [Kitasatospora sp. MAA19]|uniref:hypothetical protein n=1 Tax=Kitasatospora sp. MAA19 TaxID=3035090 RepID=UPI0024759FC0|nr:hypothetical protein [Kitasatospora sp. MAA19]MDH6709557.1 hypothetical protein [Kitasatospora sp. MAA19]
MKFVVSERFAGKAGLVVGSALVLAACSVGGGDGAAAGWPRSGRPAHGPAATETVNSVNAALGKAAEAKDVTEFGTALDLEDRASGPVAGVWQAGAPGTVRRAPAATGVSIAEGEVGEVGPQGTITYPSVTSCLVVTVYLRDGGKVGGHASLFQVPGKYSSDEVLPAVKRAVGDRPVKAVDVSGAVGAWNPSYFEKAIERYTDGAAPEPTGDAKGIGDVVAKLLGRQGRKVTVQDVPDGDITR